MLERVQKIIAESGFCSRRRAEEMIQEGKVSVNNETITIGDKADSQKDTIRIGSKIIKVEKKVYLALNKQRGVITTSIDEFNRKKVIDSIDIDVRVFPVGRLDRDATGLLFLTNDGDWGNKVIHPRYTIEKTYLATIDSPLRKEDKQAIEKGIKLNDGVVSGRVRMIDKKRIEISIHVGKNKIVKRIFNHFGYNVRELCRISIGRVNLGRLKPGRYRHLTEKEIESFRISKEIKKKKS